MPLFENDPYPPEEYDYRRPGPGGPAIVGTLIGLAVAALIYALS